LTGYFGNSWLFHHRPDLKQAVLELIVSQDGGVPFLSQSWDGNASDNAVFKERSKALIKEFKASCPVT